MPCWPDLVLPALRSLGGSGHGARARAARGAAGAVARPLSSAGRRAAGSTGWAGGAGTPRTTADPPGTAAPALVNVKAGQTSASATAPPAPPLGAASSRAVFLPGAGSARPMWLKKAIGLAGTAGQQIPSPSSLLATLAHSVHLLGVPLVCITLLSLLRRGCCPPPPPQAGPAEVKVPGGTVAAALVLLDPAAESRAGQERGFHVGSGCACVPTAPPHPLDSTLLLQTGLVPALHGVLQLGMVLRMSQFYEEKAWVWVWSRGVGPFPVPRGILNLCLIPRFHSWSHARFCS